MFINKEKIYKKTKKELEKEKENKIIKMKKMDIKLNIVKDNDHYENVISGRINAMAKSLTDMKIMKIKMLCLFGLIGIVLISGTAFITNYI